MLCVSFLNALSSKYSKPDKVEEMKNYKGNIIGQICKWQFENVLIRMDFNVLKKQGGLYYSKIVKESIKQFREQKEKSENKLKDNL